MKIIKPTFLINKEQCHKNIEKMAAKARKHLLTFRPHFKTHQSADIGELFRESGINKITVSSIDMALYFMENGWHDITIAFPINILEIDGINELADRITLNLLVLDAQSIAFLEQKLQSTVNLFIKIDTGYRRSGIDYKNTEILQTLIDTINKSKKLIFKGFLTHAGHTYHAKSVNEIHKIHSETVERMNQLKNCFKKYHPIISIGNTPSCSIVDNFDGIDEIRPGNFVYYDITQHSLGSCTINQISVALACPIVDKHADENKLVIYGGGVHLSKEYLEVNSQKSYGKVVKLNDFGWLKSLKGCYVKKLSQEHGILHIADEYLNELNIGDVIGILPVHSCMTANLMKRNTKII